MPLPLICANCQTENPASAKFCTECATPLARACSNCGTPNPPAAKFCSECATAMASQPGGSSSSAATGGGHVAAPVAERRVVSVLFADLVGFTPFAEDRDPEQVRESLSAYFETARQVVERYGGTIEKFIGDAVMAVWGVPVAHEDDAERAVRAGMDIVQAVRGLGPGIEARAGILTGEAAVTLGATDQGMVAGDLVNTASRLQSVAPPGTVLVGESTQRSASAGIVFEPTGDHDLKGKGAPVPAWRALRVAGGIGGRWRSEGPEAPFVGRMEELTLLKDLFHATARERRARLVSVVGPAGIGKSRLSREFFNHVDAEAEDFWGHHGRSPAYGEGLTFWALGEMIRQRAGLAETDDEATTRARIHAMVVENVPDDADRRWIEPCMLTLLGLSGGETDTEQLFGAWRTFFEHLAADVPVVLAFEDLHWADSGMLDFIDYLLEWSRTQPIFILTLARPELLEKRPTWGAGKRQFTSVYLEPLPEPAIRELLLGLVPGLPDAATRAIAGRADGIPLYAVETVRMLVADGRLVEEGGAYAPSGDLSELAVPESLAALIGSRLDALDPEVRALAQDATVLGQRFTVTGLSAVSGLEREAMEAPLEALVRRELLTMENDPRSPERNQYGFVQSLIREVAYNTLARRDRKVRHLAAARFFESLETDELAGALAGQYVAAHANADSPEETAALAAQARVALRAAADRAASLGASDQAFEFSSQALGLAQDPADEAELALRTGVAARTAGRYTDSEGLLRRALEQFTATNDREGMDRAITALATTLVEASRYSEAVELLEPVLGETIDFAARPELIAAGAQLSRAHMLHFEFDAALRAADRVLPAAEFGDMGIVVADLLVTKGTTMTMSRRVREGLGLIRAGQELGESLGATLVVMRAMQNQASSIEWISPRLSFETSREGLSIARRIGHRGYTMLASYNAAGAALTIGEWVWADSVLDDLLDESLEEGDWLLAAAIVHGYRALRGQPRDDLLARIREVPVTELSYQLLVASAEAYEALAVGRDADAMRHFRLENWSEGASDNFIWFVHLAAWNHDDSALGDVAQALHDSGRHGPAVDALALTLNAARTGLAGSSQEAVSMFERAADEYRALEMPLQVALVGIDMAAVLDPSQLEVQQAIQNSRVVLSELGAIPLLERLSSAVARAESSPAAGDRTTEPVPIAETEVATS